MKFFAKLKEAFQKQSALTIFSDLRYLIPELEFRFLNKLIFLNGSNAFGMKPDASGLGLYIAKNTIESHGGKIGFESAEGKGSQYLLV